LAGSDSHCSYFLPFKNPPKPAQTRPNRPGSNQYTFGNQKKLKKNCTILANDSGD